MELKKCTSCKREINLDLFHNDASRKDGKNPHCKQCRKEREPQRPEYKKDWYEKNRELTLSRVKNHNNTNRELKREYGRKHYQLNKDYYKQNVVRWQKNNPHIVAWRRVLHNVLRSFKKRKDARTKEILGYSANDLKLHIESLWTPEMSWENYGEWHIDHIVPVNTFDPLTDIKIVNALSNLRPLWATSRSIQGVFYEGNLNRCKKFPK